MFLNFNSGSVPDATDPPSRAPVVLGVSISLYIVAIVFVSAQILVKGKLGKLGIEDMLISVASVRYLSVYLSGQSNTNSVTCCLGHAVWTLGLHGYRYVTCPSCSDII